MPQLTLLHLIPAGGGGTERCVRDLAAGLTSYRHLLLHLGEDGSALEDPGSAQFLGLKSIENADFEGFARGLLTTYRVSAVHLHLVGPSALDWIKLLPRLGIGYAVTLHDLSFLSPRIFADGEAPEPAIDRSWIDGLRDSFAGAFVITSPSVYVDTRFKAHFHELETVRVEPGLRDPHPDIDLRLLHSKPTIGVIGALGAHKGAARLEAVWALPAASALRWVLLGYSEKQLYPMQSENPEIIVHGPFESEQAPGLIDSYDIDLIWFPNRLAESFSYALSECWAAGRAALVPRWGALGERVTRHGGGFISNAADDPLLIVAELEQRVIEERGLLRRAEHLQQRRLRVPSLASMLEAFELLYRRMPMQTVQIAEPWSSGEVANFLQTQLGPLSFRKENIRLARDYGQVRIWAQQLEGSVEEFRNDRDHWLDQFTRQSAYLQQVSENLDGVQSELARWVDRCWAAESALGNAHAELAISREAERLLQTLNQQLQIGLDAQLERAEAATAWGVELDRRLLAIHAELEVSRTQIAKLAAQIAPLRIKGSRYDRVLAIIPSPLKQFARWLGARRRESGSQSQP